MLRNFITWCNIYYFCLYSSFIVQGSGRWPVPASVTSTFCMVYPVLFFVWAYTKEPASELVCLPSFSHVQIKLICIFLPCHSVRTLLILSFISSFLILSSLVHHFTDLGNRISTVCNIYMSLFRIVQRSLPYSSVGTSITA
jgi:hypothetical protein